MLKFFINAISHALAFSKVEARGTLILIFIIVAGIGFSRIYVSVLRSVNEVDTTEVEALAQWITEVESSYEVRKEDTLFGKSNYLPVKKDQNASKAVNQKAVKNEEVKNVHKKINATPIILLDLNTASAVDLQQVKGIGPTFSTRIVKFREKLGGFASSHQLKEVYGLTEETILEIEKFFSVQSAPTPFDINNDSAKVLARHPYISYDLAWIIINYRKQNGDIDSGEELKKIQAIDEDTFARLKPYLN